MTTRHRKPGQDRLFRPIEGSKLLIASCERPLPARMRGEHVRLAIEAVQQFASPETGGAEKEWIKVRCDSGPVINWAWSGHRTYRRQTIRCGGGGVEHQLTGTANPVTVKLSIGDDCGTTPVNAVIF